MPSRSRPQSRARHSVAAFGAAPFFPEPYPGETLYSIIARYRRTRQLRHVGLSIDMFGMEARVWSPTLPFAVRRIAIRQDGIGLDAERLVHDHTAYRYYTAVSSDQFADGLMAEMLAVEGRPVMAAGQRGAPVGLLSFMRFCPACFAEMEKENGETHWRLVHQLPIVTVCLDHGTILRDSTIPATGVIPGFQVPGPANCPPDAPATVPDGVDVCMLTTLSKAAVDIMSRPRRDPAKWREGFQRDLGLRGLLTPAGRLRITDIQTEVNRLLAPIAPAFPSLPLDAPNRLTWFGFQMMPARASSTDRVLMLELALSLM